MYGCEFLRVLTRLSSRLYMIITPNDFTVKKLLRRVAIEIRGFSLYSCILHYVVISSINLTCAALYSVC